MGLRTVAVLLLASSFGCNKEDETSAAPTEPTGPTEPSTVTTEYTWYQDVRPLVYQKCAQCHNDNGIGTGDFTTYDGIFPLALAVEDAVGAGRMPLPTADPECRPYHGSERMQLTDSERAMLVDWSGGGAPEGDEATAAPADLFDGHLDDIDVVMEMPVGRELPAEQGANDYFCTIPDNPFGGLNYIDGIDVQLGDPSVVHHMCLFVDLAGNAGTGYGVDGDTAKKEGFECGNPIIEQDWLPVHCWAPGMEPVEFPPGMAMLAIDGLQFVIQMHYYNPDGEPHTDQSAYAFRTASGAERTVEMFISGPENLWIPAGEPAWTQEASDRADRDYDILGAFPHMHLLGTHFSATLSNDDGTEQCVVEGPYDFGHQATYMFEEPLRWEAGASLSMACTWDNSASNPNQMNTPPLDVFWGEGTDEEMCYLLYYVSEV